ncbi:MAG TPA: imidazoleglycerol-phosphate dehydratase HisB [Bacillota bacterium]|jgi:imidazoleglycerol-phosphate dehydratase|nr:imidazoleglycerol-phosphate dehydratase HisB [Bacillota bacterium]HOL50614.1 imidazoleglycerol-phosphate dehydratase HisB [Bacillota bacterium]HPQ03592.1 imidazoleglycerol-phosphate dehydratase HisB [Bacillota bacterium]
MPKPRLAEVHRKTSETSVELRLILDAARDHGCSGRHQANISTCCGFFDHMLRLLAFHAQFSLDLHATGDIEVDYHHLVEDVGICIGEAFCEALGDKQGIARFGSALVPMDDALSMAVVDLSGRPFLHFNVPMPCAKVGDFDTELVEEFMRALASNGKFTLHVDLHHGWNTHHIIESVFKAVALALRQAAAAGDTSSIPSTKGVL